MRNDQALGAQNSIQVILALLWFEPLVLTPFTLISNIIYLFIFYQMPTVLKNCRHICQLLMYTCEAPVPKSPLVFDHTFSCISFVSFISIAQQLNAWGKKKNTSLRHPDTFVILKNHLIATELLVFGGIGDHSVSERRKCWD